MKMPEAIKGLFKECSYCKNTRTALQSLNDCLYNMRDRVALGVRDRDEMGIEIGETREVQVVKVICDSCNSRGWNLTEEGNNFLTFLEQIGFVKTGEAGKHMSSEIEF